MSAAPTEADAFGQQPQPRPCRAGIHTNHPVWTCGVIFAWYCISTGIILATKWLFSTRFPCPLTVTTYSNAIAALLAAIVTRASGRRLRCPSRALLRSYVAPIGVCTALEIGCSNVALELLTVSFGTILKGSSPVFSFGWALLFGLETFSWRIASALLLIAVGIALASLGEGRAFVASGFVLQLLSMTLGGFRWALTQKLLQGGAVGERSGNDTSPGTVESRSSNENSNEGAPAAAASRLSPLAAVLYTCPVTSMAVLPFAVALEGGTIIGGKEEGASAPWVVLGTMTAIATLVFVLLLSEYWLVRATSILTLSVAGVFKELITIGGGIFLFAEAVDALNAVGFAICQVGILSYVWLRTKGTLAAVAEYAPVIGASDSRHELATSRTGNAASAEPPPVKPSSCVT